ncbi:glycosyltransferase family 4 protein [Mycoplasmatota bacterium]|nr:glycosyltransferase family 4 protein [Mycoplasmatota bacterium]
MKILIVSHEYPPIGGGGANACFYLSKSLVNNGHTVTVLTTGFEELVGEMNENGVNVIRLNTRRKSKTSSSFVEMFSYLKKAMKVAEVLHKKNHYDICQVFFGIPAGPIGLHLKRKFNLPYVVRMGGGDVPGFQKRFKYIYKLTNPFLRKIWKNANSLIANSEGLKRLALDFDRKSQIAVVHNGVNIHEFTPKHKENDEEINILFVSRLIERKGLQHIIPLLPEIKEKSNKKVVLTVVGGGPYCDYLIQLCKEYNVVDLVNFEGHKNHDQLLQYYQNADLFVLPSSKEGMPNVVLEAMSCGLPILMTKCEGSKELIQDNGFIINPSLKEQTVKNFTELINDKELRIKLGLNSRKLIENAYSLEKVVQSYESIYNRVMEVEENESTVTH